MNIIDILSAINPDAEFNIVGVRPGEKLHEQMIGFEDAPFTYEYESYYKILPQINYWHLDNERIGNGILVDKTFTYNSASNTEWMSVEFLRKWIEENQASFLGTHVG